ncbi:transporter substrate-binding domain-containing protein [Massilia sp. HP4]|uniref:transporter substrate-binding domain-containing protein n=1 Tax=Massilia sp. HP4 TaxID=2562316 RepID=UPI0027D970A9|nr:transporter substrate-binding domain-containing protein [Massilia sp. HP4]
MAGWRLVRALAVTMGMTVVLPQPLHAADLMSETRARGALRIAVEGTYPPFNFKDPKTGHLTGYDIEVARLVATRLKLRPQFVPTEWSAILPAVSSGKVDAAISQVIITPEREQAYDFSIPYTYSSFQLIVRKNERANYRSLADLKGRKLGVREGSVFEQQAKAVPGIEVRSYPAVPENLQDLAFGRIDASLDDSLMVNYLLKNSELPIKAGPRVGQLARIGVAFGKGNPRFKAAVDKVLTDARADGTLRRLSLKWFGIDASSATR